MEVHHIVNSFRGINMKSPELSCRNLDFFDSYYFRFPSNIPSVTLFGEMQFKFFLPFLANL